VGLNVRGARTFASTQTGVEDREDLIERGQIGCILIVSGWNLKVLNPKLRRV
jgi:hypothetical protein